LPPAIIPGPDQLNVAPDVAEEPLSVTVLAEHVNVWDAPAFASGLVVLEDTTTFDEEVQPFAGSVTVTVYVPAVLTVGLAVFAPDTIPAPVQLNVAPDVAEDPFSVTESVLHVSV
jgi:hypothetical protein